WLSRQIPSSPTASRPRSLAGEMRSRREYRLSPICYSMGSRPQKSINTEMITMLKKLSLSFFILAAYVALPWDDVAGQTNGSIDDADRTETIETLIKELNENYVFPEVAKKLEADLRARAAKGEYNTLEGKEFAKKLTEDLRAISKDKHLSVSYSAKPIPPKTPNAGPSEEAKRAFENQMRMNNYGFKKIENLPGNIGYVDFRGFLDPELGAETVRAAMSFFRHSDDMIFDLRQNGGGDPKIDRKSTRLNSSHVKISYAVFCLNKTR